ncbi:hypothetical protein DFH07DRAFT_740445 [Mycena maculata]|uniref:Uncharacterized protein n=1 Tax=Mycena maculata TaxID=230809 RepID=A0AAD7JAP9_9AGAR|nr:hypothetical protein DFH07DRAFT_740445 [Mycena maculata]
MTNVRKPHTVNSSGIGRKNCGCVLCYRDRTQLDCAHPGKCIETAKMLIDSIFAKWNPAIPDLDLCEELSLTEEPYLGPAEDLAVNREKCSTFGLHFLQILIAIINLDRI